IDPLLPAFPAVLRWRSALGLPTVSPPQIPDLHHRGYHPLSAILAADITVISLRIPRWPRCSRLVLLCSPTTSTQSCSEYHTVVEVVDQLSVWVGAVG
ncbi:hypothetical protein BZA05DRAFT_396735, partial [Tricharina praecox]|uniref:uncharacterized protein n=1 Tax=Tricharina praecox TaxID=43433 RepID=UPI00221F7638